MTFHRKQQPLYKMELIQNYNSEESFVEPETSDRGLKPRRVRSVYLVTYSQANLEKFPSRSLFADTVAKLFESTKIKVVQWVCSLEDHEISGVHYHMAIKLNSNKRWSPVKCEMSEQHGVELHFSSKHTNYYSAWRYTTKSDKNYEQSPDHPDLTLTNSPQTSKATRKRRAKQNQNVQETSKCKKQKRLSQSTVSDIIRTKNIKTKTELYALAETPKQQGKVELFNFIINRNTKKITELITTTWELINVQSELIRSKTSRMEILTACLSEECVEGCNDMWYYTALETLQRNDICVQTFTGAIKVLLEHGRGKYRNILIVGPANCGKTFILKVLTKIFRAFVNPASSTFAWVGAENAEVIFLNDFRWSAQLIPWHDLLLLLEGEHVHLPAPKTHFAQDILLSEDTPIVATSSGEIQYIKNGVICERETEMMAVRWKVFKFWNSIAESKQRDLVPCKHCFARLVLYQE